MNDVVLPLGVSEVLFSLLLGHQGSRYVSVHQDCLLLAEHLQAAEVFCSLAVLYYGGGAVVGNVW